MAGEVPSGFFAFGEGADGEEDSGGVEHDGILAGGFEDEAEAGVGAGDYAGFAGEIQRCWRWGDFDLAHVDGDEEVCSEDEKRYEYSYEKPSTFKGRG